MNTIRHSFTDTGRVRQQNEDSVYPRPGESPDPIRHRTGTYDLLIVADGMGGHARGDLASAAAIAAVTQYLSHGSWVEPFDGLRKAYGVANDRVHAAGDERGTTLVTALIRRESGQYWLANVGDSRGYLLDRGRLRQLTRDHSRVEEEVALGQITREEARHAKNKNVLTRAIGPNADVEVDIKGPFQLKMGQRLVLCSDGLHGMVEDRDIADLAWSTELGRVPGTLVAAANEAGGKDNISVVVAALPTSDRTIADAPLPPPVAAFVVFGRRVPLSVAGGVAGSFVLGIGALALAFVAFGGAGDDDGQATPDKTPIPTASTTVATATATVAASPSLSASSTRSATTAPTVTATTPGTAQTPSPTRPNQVAPTTTVSPTTTVTQAGAAPTPSAPVNTATPSATSTPVSPTASPTPPPLTLTCNWTRAEIGTDVTCSTQQSRVCNLVAEGPPLIVLTLAPNTIVFQAIAPGTVTVKCGDVASFERQIEIYDPTQLQTGPGGAVSTPPPEPSPTPLPTRTN